MIHYVPNDAIGMEIYLQRNSVSRTNNARSHLRGGVRKMRVCLTTSTEAPLHFLPVIEFHERCCTVTRIMRFWTHKSIRKVEVPSAALTRSLHSLSLHGCSIAFSTVIIRECEIFFSALKYPAIEKNFLTHLVEPNAVALAWWQQSV